MPINNLQIESQNIRFCILMAMIKCYVQRQYVKKVYFELFINTKRLHHFSLALGASGEESDEAARESDAEDVVHVCGGSTQDVEGGDDDEGEEERVVVENRECCGLILGNLILLPQNSLVLLLLTDLLVISELLVHLLGHGGLSLDGQLVLE